MATNYNLSNTNKSAAYTLAAKNRSGAGTCVVYSDIIDLVGKAALDTFTIFSLPEGATVLAAQVQVLETASDATVTLDIGAQTGTTTVGATWASGLACGSAVTAGNVVNCAGTDFLATTDTTAQQALAALTADTVIGVKLASIGATLTTGKVLVKATIAF